MKSTKLIGLIGLAGLVGLGALVYLGYIDAKDVWGARVSVKGTPFTIPTVVIAVAVDAFLLSRSVRGILISLVGLLALSLLGAWVIEATAWGGQLELPAVAQRSGSDFVALTVTVYVALLLLFLSITLFWARLRLALLGWARNRLVAA